MKQSPCFVTKRIVWSIPSALPLSQTISIRITSSPGEQTPACNNLQHLNKQIQISKFFNRIYKKKPFPLQDSSLEENLFVSFEPYLSNFSRQTVASWIWKPGKGLNWSETKVFNLLQWQRQLQVYPCTSWFQFEIFNSRASRRDCKEFTAGESWRDVCCCSLSELHSQV